MERLDFNRTSESGFEAALDSAVRQMSVPVITVLFVDDDPRLRHVWSRLIDAQPDMKLAGTLAQADGLADAANTLSPDVAIVDLTMPGLDPIEAIRALTAAQSPMRIVVYSGHSDARLMSAAFDAGAWGYIDKLTAPSEALTVLRRVAKGELVFPAQLTTPGP